MASKVNITTETVNTENSEQNNFNIKEYLSLVWRKKIWILLSVIICAGCFYLYTLRQPRVYGSVCEVMFMVGNESSATGGTKINGLTDLVVGGGDMVNINNEIEVLKSPVLMENVVEKLNLNTLYTSEELGYEEDMYGVNPISVSFLDVVPESTVSFKASKIDNKHVALSDFQVDDSKVDSPTLKVQLGTVVDSPVGRLAIAPTSNYDKFNHEISIKHVPVKSLAKQYASRVTAMLKAEFSSVVSVGFTSDSQQKSNEVLTALIEAYNQLWLTEKNKSAINTSDFIRDRLSIIEKELSGIDSEISQVKSSSNLADFNTAASAYFNQSVNYDTKAFESSTQLSIAQFLREYLQSPANADKLIPANTGTSGSIESQIQEYNKLLIKRDNLLQNSTEANPIIAEMNGNLSSMRALILQSLNNMISSYQIQASRASSKGNAYTGKISAVPSQEKQILSVERQQKVKENLYLYLLQKREENELLRMITVNNTRVILPATSTGLVSPVKSKNIMYGVLLGLAIPLIIIYLFSQLNNKVVTKHDLGGLNIPFLGEMPLLKKNRKRFSIHKLLHPHSRKDDDEQLQIVVKERSRSIVNEAFRLIRTNLDFIIETNSKSKVLIITSFNPGSGKTFISMNLAESLALKGKRVLVVDVDLRRASLSKFIGSPTHGVTTYLTGKSSDLNSLITRNPNGHNIDFLPVGAVPPNPVELLVSERFDNMIAELRQYYDYVVLDCPPYEMVADTAIMSRSADITIFVMRSGLFLKSMIADLENVYSENKLPHMALILNGIDPQHTYYSNRYGYSRQSGYYVEED